jgi:hypothetical protein
MAPRLGLITLLAACAALVPATASAASKTPSVKVAECDTDAASATFESAMRPVSGTARMAVRFTLQTRTPGTRWTTLKVPGFERWHLSRSSRSTFLFDKTVDGLAAPSDYRVVVRFQWRDALGDVLKRAKRTSRVCAQPDPRPDLRPVALEQTATGWVLTVTNAGGGDAEEVPATLAAGGRVLRGLVPGLAVGDDTGVYFQTGACVPGETLTATVDPEDDLEESDEAGNAISVTCPAS